MGIQPEDALESSPEAVEDVTAGEADASSSSAGQDGGEDQRSLLDVVRSALPEASFEDEEQHVEPEPAESSPAEAVAQEPEESGDEPEKDRDAVVLELLDKLKDDKVPLHKIERFREILEEKRQLRKQWDQVAPAVDKLNEINQAARLAGLTPDDLADFYAAPLLARQDPAKAREAISRLSAKLGLETQPLPPELQRKVDDGYIDEESAREVVKARKEAEDARREAQIRDEDRQREAAQQTGQKMAEAVDRFQKSVIESDPDYSPAVHKLVRKELTRLMMVEGKPSSPDQAVALAEKAYKTVKDDLAPFRAPPKPKSSPSGRRINTPAVPQPKTMLEAVENALRQ